MSDYETLVAFLVEALVLIAVVFGLAWLIISVGGVGSDYREGVIDAQTGRARVELVENPDGTTGWGPVIRTEVTP